MKRTEDKPSLDEYLRDMDARIREIADGLVEGRELWFVECRGGYRLEWRDKVEKAA